eukprot:m.147953 g.147953  ORF g.147953 m.147953 type:complete len:229 (+) comp16124_c0_seq1:110-796(+)
MLPTRLRIAGLLATFGQAEMSSSKASASSSSSSSRLPKLYRIYPVAVKSIKDYGAFVEIEGFEQQALLHKSQMATTKVEDPHDVVSVGDFLYAKVIEVKDDGRISVSIKTVRQSDGTDMDTTNIIIDQDNLRKRATASIEAPKLQLGAVLNTVCTKCGTKGHFAKDCFGGGKTYSVIEEEYGSPSSDSASDDEHEQKRAKKDKKEKKKKKNKVTTQQAERKCCISHTC